MFGRRATQQHQGREIVHVEVDSGYRPATATVRAGVPIRIVFHRIDDDPCTDRVIFSAPRIERRLAVDRATAVDLPARSIGEIRYTCGMGRYSGTIHVTEAADDRLGWLRRERREMTNAATVALVVIAVGLPVVAALALLFLDASAASSIASIASIAAIAGLVWMFAIPWARRELSRRADVAMAGRVQGTPEADEVEPVRRAR